MAEGDGIPRFRSSDYVDRTLNLTVERRVLRPDGGMWRSGLHWHEFYEIEYVTRGHGMQTLGGSEYVLRPGCFYLVTPFDCHEIAFDDEAELLNISFGDAVMPEDCLCRALLRDNVVYADGGAGQNARLLCELIQSKYAGGSRSGTRCLYMLVECLIAELLDAREDSARPVGRGLEKAIVFLHRNFRDNPSLGDAAQAAGYNRTYFCSRFREAIGMPYSQYLNELKLNRAQRLVVTTGEPMAFICYDCGFTSMSNFLRLYRARFGCAPTETRRAHAHAQT